MEGYVDQVEKMGSPPGKGDSGRGGDDDPGWYKEEPEEK